MTYPKVPKKISVLASTLADPFHGGAATPLWHVIFGIFSKEIPYVPESMS